MSKSFGNPLRFLRDRRRWVHGRCPRCNRNLYATFPYYMADYPNCLVCKNETAIAWRVWHKHRQFASAKRPDVACGSE